MITFLVKEHLVLKRARHIGIIQGIEVCSHNIEVSHLKLVDVMILLLVLKEVAVARNFNRILECYGAASGLIINYKKSEIIHSINNDEWAAELSRRMRCNCKKLPTKYLGIPLGENPIQMSP